MDKVNLAVIGVGHHGRKHAEIFTRIEQVNLVGVVDVDSDVAREVAARWNTTAYTDSSDVIDLVDAVSIAVPANKHYVITKKFLSRNKNVFLEKPIAETSEQAEELVQIAKERNVIFQIGHVERFNPAIKALEQLLTYPRFIESHRLCQYNPRGTDVGVVMDLMIHDIDIVLHLVKDKVKSLTGVGVRVLSQTEDIANARIEFHNGCIANLTVSRVSPENMRKIRIFQHDAYISLDYRKQEGLVYRKINSEIVREEIPTEKSEPLELELRSFVDCVLNSHQPVVSGEQAKQAVDIAMEIIKDIEARNQWESLRQKS